MAGHTFLSTAASLCLRKDGSSYPETSRSTETANKASWQSKDVLDIATVRSYYCSVHVSVMSQLSFNNCPIVVDVAIQHPITRDVRRTVERERFGPSLCRRLPGGSLQVYSPTSPTSLRGCGYVRYGCCFNDGSVVRMKHCFTSYYQRIPAKVTLSRATAIYCRGAGS